MYVNRLQSEGIIVVFYYGGFLLKVKKDWLKNWKNYKVSIMVVINVFGMGIDYFNVWFVIYV